MTYGDSGGEDEPPLAGSEGDLPARAASDAEKGQVGTLFGDLLGLFASFLVGLYEVSSFSPKSASKTGRAVSYRSEITDFYSTPAGLV